MPRKIDLSGPKKKPEQNQNNVISTSYTSGYEPEEISQRFTSILLNHKPEKFLYSLSEASEVLGVSQEFIRRRIKSGKIKCVRLGDKPAINIIEMARILSNGV